MRAGHEMTMPCRVPPKCDPICLVHLKGVSKAHRHVRIRRGRTPGVIELELLGDRNVEDTVVGSPLVGRADERAFRAGAVVADDVDDQRVIESQIGVGTIRLRAGSSGRAVICS